MISMYIYAYHRICVFPWIFLTLVLFIQISVENEGLAYNIHENIFDGIQTLRNRKVFYVYMCEILFMHVLMCLLI